MKKLIAVIILVVVGFAMSACVDIDEALPHYHVPSQQAPQAGK